MARYTETDDLLRLIPMEEPVARMAIINAPTADVVEVVRCKYCWKRGDEDFCPLVSDNCYPPNLPDDWFCKDGERRKDG